MIDDKNPRRINPKGIGLIYIYIHIIILGMRTLRRVPLILGNHHIAPSCYSQVEE